MELHVQWWIASVELHVDTGRGTNLQVFCSGTKWGVGPRGPGLMNLSDLYPQ